MVFMGATTFDGNVDLNGPADDDLDEMTAVSSVDDRLNIFVERHDNRGVSQHHIGKPATKEWTGGIRAPNVGLGDGQALRAFVKKAFDTAGHRFQDHSMLVLWGHSYDFAFGRKRERDGTVDALDFGELGDRLREIQADMKQRYDADGSIRKEELPVLDVIGFDACDCSTVEMACQLQPFADYLLGSEVGIPLPGWPYDRILDRITDVKGQRIMGPAEFGSYVVRRFCESYPAKVDAVSLTLLDLKHTVDLMAHVSWLAERLAVAIGDETVLGQLMELFSRSQTDADRPYVDVADLCVNLVRESANAEIIAAATALGDFLASPQDSVVGRSASGGGRPLIAEHGRNAGRLARLNGLSLYAPHVAPSADIDAAEKLYNKFSFAQQTHWKALVHAMARS